MISYINVICTRNMKTSFGLSGDTNITDKVRRNKTQLATETDCLFHLNSKGKFEHHQQVQSIFVLCHHTSAAAITHDHCGQPV